MASIAAFQPILEGGSYVGYVVRTDAAAHGLDGPWNVYRYVGRQSLPIPLRVT